MRVDYFVIGAGLAGLTMRHFLEGSRVVLADPRPFSYKIGESLTPELFEHREVRRLLPKVRALPTWSEKRGTAFVSGERVAAFPVGDGDAGAALHVSRPEFERLLAAEWDVPIARETVLELDVERRLVRTDRETYEVERQIIDCSGPAMVVAHARNEAVALWPVWATWGYFDIESARGPSAARRHHVLRYDPTARRLVDDGAAGAFVPSRMTVLTHIDAGLWSWQIPLAHEGLLGIGIVSRHGPLSPSEYEALALRHAAPGFVLRPRSRCGADWRDRLHARGHFARRARVASGPNHVLLSEAFAFADPVYSIGAALAVNKAIELAAVLNAGRWDERLSAAYNKECDRLLLRAEHAFEHWYSGELLESDAAAAQVAEEFLSGGAFEVRAARRYGHLLRGGAPANDPACHDVDQDVREWLELSPAVLLDELDALLGLKGERTVAGWLLAGAVPKGCGVELHWTRAGGASLVVDVDFDEPADATVRAGPLSLAVESLVGQRAGPDVDALLDALAARMRGREVRWLLLRMPPRPAAAALGTAS